MRATELIALLTSRVENDGDLDVVLCGLDGAGYDDVHEVETVPAVRVDSVVSTYVAAKDAAQYGTDATQHDHFIYIW